MTAWPKPRLPSQEILPRERPLRVAAEARLPTRHGEFRVVAFETDDGATVYVENKGMRFGPVELLQKLKRGEPVDPKLIYFRTVPKFETGHENYRWLMQHIFVASAARHADRVVIDVHQVL